MNRIGWFMMGRTRMDNYNRTDTHRQKGWERNRSRRAFRSLFKRDGLLFTHCADNGDKEILALIEPALNVTPEVALRHLNIILWGTILSHEVEETVVNIDKLIFVAADVGDIHVVSRRTDIFHLLASKNVDGDEMDLSVTVLSSLGGRHVDDLARASFDHNVAVFTESRALLGKVKEAPAPLCSKA